MVDPADPRQRIAAVCIQARQAGVSIGMALAEARAVCTGLQHRPYELERDRHALEAIGRWMMTRFTPDVALEPPDALMLDVGGCERLFGGIHMLARHVWQHLRRMKLHANLAIAPTPGAAWAFAVSGRKPAMVLPDQLFDQLSPLPVSALRIEPDLTATLRRVGIESIGQLAQLPRSTLPARFGAILLRRLDQALGRLPEPLKWLPHRAPVRAAITFEAAIDSLDTIRHALHDLILQIVPVLERRGSGARQLRAIFRSERADSVVKSIVLSRPSREAKHLVRLLGLATENLKTRQGIIAIELAVPVIERLVLEQTQYVEDESDIAERDLAHLLETLKARLGDDGIQQIEPVESHLPERAYRCVEARAGVLRLSPSPVLPPRPLALLQRPLEIGVIVTPSEDRHGRPVSFTHEGDVHRLRFAVGPERIGSVWWDGHNKTRDYFDVEDDVGERFWIFRVLETFKWYLHGHFA